MRLGSSGTLGRRLRGGAFFATLAEDAFLAAVLFFAGAFLTDAFRGAVAALVDVFAAVFFAWAIRHRNLGRASSPMRAVAPGPPGHDGGQPLRVSIGPARRGMMRAQAPGAVVAVDVTVPLRHRLAVDPCRR